MLYDDNKVWEFVVKSPEEIRQRGLCGWYAILVDGKDELMNKTKEDYIKEGYTVLQESEFDALVAENERNQCNDWKEITEEEYERALNVLPPKKWKLGGFYIGECYSGSLYGFYQKWGEKYYTSLQSIYTDRNEILENLKKFIERNVK